jgi:hypothetical protein
MRWLSRIFAASALLGNHNVLISYCTKQVNKCNDPVNKYWLRLVTNPQYYVALTVMNNVLGGVASPTKFFY